MTKSKALVFNNSVLEHLEVQELEINTDISDDELLIRNEFAGICGSDIHVYRQGRTCGLYVPGHELCGKVEKIGSNFKDVNGERIVMRPKNPDTFVDLVDVEIKE